MRRSTIASRILVAVVGILLATVITGGVLEVQLTHRTFDRQYEDRARGVATVVAQIPLVRQAVAVGDVHHALPALADRIARGSGASYVVITDRAGVRFSHPNRQLIGKRLEEPVAVLDGRSHVGIDHGSLGRSANGKAPILDGRGRVIGQVSVGIVEAKVAAAVNTQIVDIVWYSAIALTVGVLVALVMARAVKRTTFGLEPAEIGTLLQDREAMLHGINEGVIGVDRKGRVTLINDEARRLIGASDEVVGRTVDDVLDPGQLRDLLTGADPASPLSDQVVAVDGALLVVNRNVVAASGRTVGSVITLRDRTELETLMRELRTTTGMADALRAQEHEFSNRLHVIGGLIELGEYVEAGRFVDAITRHSFVSADDLRARVGPPTVAALLLAKMSVATERGATLTIASGARMNVPEELAEDVMTIVGNLIDNAIDAVSQRDDAPREILVDLGQTSAQLAITVEDNGPGLPAGVEAIFVDGFSTKEPRGHVRRGLGLSLVQRIVRRANGTLVASSPNGARFEVTLPIPRVPAGAGPIAERALQ